MDGYQNWLSTLLINIFASSNVAKYVGTGFETVEDHVVCLVDVKVSPEPVYAYTAKGNEIFFIRVGNSTRVVSGSELVLYIKGHF